MGPVLLKLLREAIVGSHELARDRTSRDGQPMGVGFSPLTATLGLFAKFAEPDAHFAGEIQEMLVELGLAGEKRREAMELFFAGAQSPFTFEQMLTLCREFTTDNVWLRAVLISLLFRLAHASGTPGDEVSARLRQACASFGRDYQESLNFFNEESAQRATEKRWIATKMNLAYGVLGCVAEEPLEAIKKRYRSLAKQLHPDLAVPKGLPDDEIRLCADRFREVQEAYQFVLVQRESR